MTGDTQCHDSEHAETLEMEYLHCDSTVCCNHYVVLVLWLQNTAYITVKSKSYTVNLVFQVKPSSSGKKNLKRDHWALTGGHKAYKLTRYCFFSSAWYEFGFYQDAFNKPKAETAISILIWGCYEFLLQHYPKFCSFAYLK